MKHTFKKLASFLLIGMLSAGIANAQVPQKFNYQGIARDVKGNPIGKQQMTLKISVLPTSDATEAEYEETQLITTNEFGLYTLQIGNGIAITGDMKTVKWETGNKYIKVAIDPKGGTNYVDMGTTQLLSVPYAIYADKAGIAKESEGTTKGTRLGGVSTPIGSTGALNYVARFTAPNEIDKSSIYDNGNFVGIGTTTQVSPTYKMQLESPGEINFLTKTTAPNRSANFRLWNSSNLGLEIYQFGNAAPGTYMGLPRTNLSLFNSNTGTFAFNSSADLLFGNNLTPRLFIQNGTGNIGIGTGIAAPGAKLEVNGLSQATGIRGTANVSNLLTQTNRASIGGYKESIAILGEGKATNPTASTINLGVAGMANTANKYNVGVQGEAKNGLVDNIGVLGAGNGSSTSNFTAGVLGEINTVGTGATSVNYAVAGIAPIVAAGNSWAGYFDGKVKIKDGSQANNYVFTSDAAGTGTWMNPSANPLFASSANDWHVTGNTVSATGKYLGTNDNFPLQLKVNNTNAGIIDNTTHNAYYGYDAGTANLPIASATDNTGIGYNALKNNISYRNTAVGQIALEQNTTGIQNTAIGDQALRNNTIGGNNTSVGHQSMHDNMLGANNTAIGVNAIFSNTTGYYNTATGNDVLVGNTTGSWNVANGTSALYKNSTGDQNVAIGGLSMTNNQTGSNNTAIGFQSMSDGASTNTYNTTNATAVGSYSTVGNNSTNATAIGSKTYAPNNNTVILGSINGVNGATANTRTGIGTTAPTSTLHNAGSFSIAWRTSQISGVDVLGDLDHVINIVVGASASIQLPDPTTCPYREYIIVNQNSVTRTITDVLGNGYWNFSGSNVNIIPANSSISVIAAPGGSWNQIR
jgi:trimeric autotransporter adhesin